MSTPNEFATECRLVAKALRRVPNAIRRELAAQSKEKIATPLAVVIGGRLEGPYAARLAGQVKPRASASPKIVIGGGRKIVSGGATGRQLIFGNEYGGGVRQTAVPRASHKRRGRGAGYRRLSTMQFVPAHPSVFKTVGDRMDWVLDTYADIVLGVLDRELPNG